MGTNENKGETTALRSRRIAKCAPVNIEFQDLTYSVRDGHLRGASRKLLNSVNGIFKSGELTAIMGPSGAGKSTLLNILAGYVSVGVKGTIKINDRPRDMKIFNKLSSYIMQDDIIQPRLTVKEAMMIAAHLKLGRKISDKEKNANVEEICTLLGLQNCFDTRSEYLSGGQRKRLTVALELVNNPPVIFLDEPTTGLDNYAIKQCMDLLNQISKEGRTVICTIHQPPTSLFQTFDKVYVLAKGLCVYNGSPSQLVSFLNMSQFDCPQSHTPAEYIIELVQSHSETTNILSAYIENGKSCMTAKVEAKPKRELVEYTNEIYQDTTQVVGTDVEVTFPLSGTMQFLILLKRMVMQMSRNRTMLYIQFFHHLLSGLLIGLIFFGIGNNGSQTFSVFKYCISVTVFFMYTHVMSPVIMFPLEVKLMRREYFNRWYSLKAFYMALTIATTPLLIIFGLMFLSIVYFITDQPVEIDRFLMFTIMGLLLGLCSQGLGYTIGASCSILNGSIVGPSILAPLVAFSIYGMGYRASIEPVMKVLMALSYVRHGVEGFCNSLFDGREPLECVDEIYCHYANPKLVMLDMGMAGTTYTSGLLGVLIFMILFRVMAYMALKYRLSSEFSVKFANYAAKIMQNE